MADEAGGHVPATRRQWDEHNRWIPEAARLLRPGGRLVFMARRREQRLP
jgi:hypothetical protein